MSVNPRYTSPGTVRGDSIYRNYKVRGNQTGILDPSEGGTRITFDLPNPAQSFLQTSEVFLRGEILVSATNDLKEAFSVMTPQISDCQTIIQRVDFQTGGRLISQDLSATPSVIQKCIRGSGQRFNQSVHLPQPEDMVFMPESEARYTPGATSATYKPFSIRLQTRSTQLFGPSQTDDYASRVTNVMLPLFAMPQSRLDIYFRPPNEVVQVAATADDEDIVASYLLRNLVLDCSYISSRSMMSNFISRGLRTTWESIAYNRFVLPAITAGTKYEVNIPTAFRSVNHIFFRFIGVDQLTNTQIADRLKLSSPDFSHNVQTLNLRLNGRNRYAEDLDAIGALNEFRRIFPESRKSSFIAKVRNPPPTTSNEQKELDDQQQILALLAGTDHLGDSAQITGFRAASNVGGMTLIFSVDGNVPTGTILQIFTSYNSFFSCNNSGQCSIQF